MRCSIVVLVALATGRLALAQESPASPDAPAASCRDALDGHVVDHVTHEPIAGATVTAGAQVAITAEDGRFRLESLCPGPLSVTAERADHRTTTKSVNVPDARSIEIELDELDTETIEVHGKAPDPTNTRSETTISGAALEAKRGRSFSEVIADVPGVTQLRSSTGVGKPIIRGQYGRRLLLLVDGVRHRSQEWGLDHAPEVDPFSADKLTVVRGASGVRYGSDAIGGAVIAEPPELLREPGYAGELHAIGISNGTGGNAAGRFQHAPEAIPGLAYQLQGSYRRLAAARTPDYALDNTGVEEWSAGGRVGYRRGKGEYTLAYAHYQAKLGVCSCLRIESREDFLASLDRERPIGSELYEAQFAIDRAYQRAAHDLAVARGTWELSRGRLTATYAYQWDHRKEFDIVREAVTGPQYDFALQSHDMDVSFTHVPIHLDDHWHLRGQTGVVGMLQTHDYVGRPLVPSHDAVGAGVYAIERLSGHDLEIEAGVRYDVLSRRAQIARQDYLRLVRSGQLTLDACGNDGDDPVECASTFHTVSASLGGVYRLTDEWSAKVDLSTASRPPNPDEQYLNGTAPTFPVYGLGKPDLGPETTYSASATTTLSTDHVTAEVSAYANRIDDYIYFAPAFAADGTPLFDVLIQGTFPRFTTRPLDALFVGADGGVAWRPIPAIELGATVSYVRASDRANGRPLVFVPPLRVGANATYKRPAAGPFRDAFFSLNGTLVAQQSRYDEGADFAPPPPAYFLAGAEAGASLPYGADDAQRLDLALVGTNLTNTHYRDYTSLLRYFADQPGWQVVVRASLHFSGR